MPSAPQAPLVDRKLALRFTRNDSGATAVMAALTAPLLLAFAALGAEGGYAYFKRAKLQSVADASALSAAAAKGAQGDAILEATAVAASLGYQTDSAGVVAVQVENPPLSGSQAGNADATLVRVSYKQDPMLARVFRTDPYTISAKAVAYAKKTNVGAGGCMMSLDKAPSSNSAGIYVGGTAAVNMPNCNVYSMSTYSNSITTGGGGRLTANEVFTVGGIAGVGVSAAKTTTYQPLPVGDPYEFLPSSPMSTGERCDFTSAAPNGTVTIGPGYYCGGINISGNRTVVTMSPGLYVVVGGDFKVGSGATVTANGVTIIAAPQQTAKGWWTSSFDIGSGTSFTISAPTTGTYAGMALYADRRQLSVVGWTTKHSVQGGAGTNITGAVYMPAGILTYTGGGTGSGCTQLIAYQLIFAGNSNLSVDGCTGTGVSYLEKQVATTALTE